MSEILTSDNIHLSRSKSGLAQGAPINCTDLPEAVARYVRDSLAHNTRRAYQSDLRHFEVWGGSLPASPETVAAYLAAHADHLSVTTMIRRLASLSKAHQVRGLSNPIRSELVRATLRGIKRKRRSLTCICAMARFIVSALASVPHANLRISSIRVRLLRDVERRAPDFSMILQSDPDQASFVGRLAGIKKNPHEILLTD